MKKFIGGQASLLALVAGILVALVGSLLIRQNAETADAEGSIPAIQTTVDVVADTTFALPVSGSVAAMHELTIRARQSGVVSQLPVTEGDAVAAGDILAVQMSPVLLAQLAVQEAASTVREAGEASGLVEKNTAASIAQKNLYTERGYETLTTEADQNALLAARETTLAVLMESEAALSNTSTFIDENASFFPAGALEKYRNVLTDWYGNAPDYVRVGPVIQTGESTALRDLVAAMSENATSTELTTVATEVSTLAKDLSDILSKAEPEFLDTAKLSRSDTRYGAYQKERATLTGLLGDLTNAKSALSRASIGSDRNVLTSGQSLFVAEATAQSSRLQELLGAELYSGVAALGAAERQVVLAQIAEGESRSPVAAAVVKVLVEPGEFVAAGTPLMTIVSLDAQEVSVAVPEALRPLIEVGTPFVVAGETVGTVDRIAPKAMSGSVTVYLTLTKALPLGSTVQGALAVQDTASDLVRVARRELYFGQTGPYVTIAKEEKVSVSIIYDAGDWLIVDPATALTSALVPAVGMRL